MSPLYIDSDPADFWWAYNGDNANLIKTFQMLRNLSRFIKEC